MRSLRVNGSVRALAYRLFQVLGQRPSHALCHDGSAAAHACARHDHSPDAGNMVHDQPEAA